MLGKSPTTVCLSFLTWSATVCQVLPTDWLTEEMKIILQNKSYMSKVALAQALCVRRSVRVSAEGVLKVTHRNIVTASIHGKGIAPYHEGKCLVHFHKS